MQYHNIFALVRELGIPWPFTDWETSGFWSPEKGLTIEAPVFSKLPRLPTMLGQFVHTLPLFRWVPRDWCPEASTATFGRDRAHAASLPPVLTSLVQLQLSCHTCRLHPQEHAHASKARPQP